MLAEDAARPEDDHQDQDSEQHGLRPLLPGKEAETAVVERLDDADQHTADDGTEKVADTTKHCRREGDEAEPEAGVVTSLAVDLHEHGARGAGEGATQDEDVGDHL